MKPKTNLSLCKLASDFVSKLSAAGISNVVNEKSKRKKILWICLLLLTMASMSYMTYKVVYEYLTYPKLVIKQNEYNPILNFPAVTVYPLSTIPQDYVEETSLNKLWKLQDLLETASTRRINHAIEETCYTERLCTWSYFLGRCQCSKSPCEINQCSPIDKDNCSCPAAFCETMDATVCQLIETEETEDANGEHQEDGPCICRVTATSASVGKKMSNMHTEQAIDSIEDNEVKDLATLIINSKINHLTDIYTELLPTLNDIYNYGAEFSRFILSCSYEGRACDKRNFTIFHHIIYGKCYMFNYIGSSEVMPVLTTENIGSMSGLHLLLDVTPNDKLKLLSPEIGARVTLHDPCQYPFIAEDGFNVADEMSGIEISLTKINRLDDPWGKCKPGVQYNQLECQKGVLLEKVNVTCKCILRNALNGAIFANQPKKNMFHPFCSSKMEMAECVRNVTNDIENDKLSYSCLPPCQEMRFSTSVTSGSPNLKFYEKIRFIKTMKLQKARTGTFPKDLAGIKVYYTTQKVHIHKEIPIYSWDTLLANIGGNLGFFMGLSIVTFFQVTEFLWDVIWMTFTSLKSGSHKSVSRVSPNSCHLDRHLRFPYNRYRMRR